jgi:hypothetical protein
MTGGRLKAYPPPLCYEKGTCFQISTIEQEPPLTPGRVPLSSPSPKVMASSARTTSQPFPIHSCCGPRRLWPSLSSASSLSSISYSLLFSPFSSVFLLSFSLPSALSPLSPPFVFFLPFLPLFPPVFLFHFSFLLPPSSPFPGYNSQKSHSSSDPLAG